MAFVFLSTGKPAKARTTALLSLGSLGIWILLSLLFVVYLALNRWDNVMAAP